MVNSKTLTAEGAEGDGLLSALDERIRRIAEETVRALSGANDVGCVKVKTAAQMLEMSEFRVRQLIREGKLKAIHPTPRTIRIAKSEIRRFQESQQ